MAPHVPKTVLVRNHYRTRPSITNASGPETPPLPQAAPAKKKLSELDLARLQEEKAEVQLACQEIEASGKTDQVKTMLLAPMTKRITEIDEELAAVPEPKCTEAELVATRSFVERATTRLGVKEKAIEKMLEEYKTEEAEITAAKEKILRLEGELRKDLAKRDVAKNHMAECRSALDTFASMITILSPEEADDEPSDMEQQEGGARVRSRSPRTKQKRALAELRLQGQKIAKVMAELPAWDCLAEEVGPKDGEFPDKDDRKQSEANVEKQMAAPEVQAEIERRVKEQVALATGAAPVPPIAPLALGLPPTPAFGGG